MPEIATTVTAVIFWLFQVQLHHLIALVRVLGGTFVSCLYPELIAATIQARGPVKGLGPDLNTLSSMTRFDFKARNTYNSRGVGHR